MRLFDDLDYTPAFLLHVVDAYGPTTEADPDGIKLAALTVVGCLLGTRASLRRPNGRLVRTGPVTWNTLVAGASGIGRKSTTADVAVDLVRAAGRSWAAQAPERPAGEEKDEKAPDDPREELVTILGGVGSSGEATVDDLTPRNPRTVELWRQEGPPSGLLVLDEAGPLFAPEARRGPHHESLRRFLLEAYGGWQNGRNTKRGGKTLAGPVAVSSVGSVTTDELLACLNAEAVTSGFLGRIVPFIAPPTPEERLHPYWELPDQARVAALVRWLVAAGTVKEWDLLLSEEADRAWVEWYVGMHRRLGSYNGHGPSLEATLIGRYQNLAQRLAIALTVADWTPAPYPFVEGRLWRRHPPAPPETLVVSEATVRACCAAAEEFAATVRRIVTDAEERSDGEHRYQEAVIQAVRGSPGGVITGEELYRRVRPYRYGLDARRARLAREELHERGAVETLVQESGGRPRHVYRLGEVIEVGQ